MGQHSDRARESLLDAAEELFAQNGIDAVSNRRIAEHVGSANHSAVAYHFGSRDGLLSALLGRFSEPMAARRMELVAELGDEPTVHDIVRSRLLPLVEMLDSLPRPSWRAQFLVQLRSMPSARQILEESSTGIGLDSDVAALVAKADGVSDALMRARSGILGSLVLGVCAEQEAQMNTGTQRGDWFQVGYFLIDAAAGMLSAPVTHPGAVFKMSERPRLI